MTQPSTPSSISGAPAVVRGVSRLFLRNHIVVQPEVSLRNNRRADLMGLSNKGEIIIVEIKTSRADLMGDQKWPEYLEYCDRFFWAVPAGFDIGPLQNVAFMPERAGLIIADAYDAEIGRPAALVPLAPARRKTETQRLARLAMRRLMGISDPDSALSGFAYE
ncbi:MAG: MmcB family DNA repair protein [Sphingomonadaceae bacterium]|nr:MmcB family DNA repair protein [Sphingomonadaceae bacterium]MBJ7388613.1 MmcB family DNA repair protein [Sphingomonadaceae bacterium]MBJ7526626.1 MmcB family DNA repair protein [Sphingomonadaceae bacterium]